MEHEFILESLDEQLLADHDTEAIRFAVDVSYKFGMAIGYLYGRAQQESWDRDDSRPKFSRLKARWYQGYGSSIYISIGAEREEQSFYFGKLHCSGYDLLMFSESSGSEFEYRVLRSGESPSTEFRLLLVRIVEKRLRQILRGIEFTNMYGLCQSSCCSEGEALKMCHRIGNLWVCVDCEERFMLAEPMPSLSDETPKEKTEREKMTASLRFEILTRDSFTCRACGRSPRKGDDIKLHVDHIKPIHHGGKTEPGNLQVLCQDCNLGKSAKWTRQIELLFQ